MAQDLANRDHSKPSLPASLAQLVKSKVRDSFGPSGYDYVELPWSLPANVSAEDRAAARDLLPAFEAYLAPPEPRWLMGRIATLLSHYFNNQMSDSLAAGVAADWAALLDGIPKFAVEQATMKWLGTETRRRPGPGDIRALALDIAGKQMQQRDRLRMIVATEESGNIVNLSNMMRPK